MITDYKQKKESVLNAFSSYSEIFEQLNELISHNIINQAENIKNGNINNPAATLIIKVRFIFSLFLINPKVSIIINAFLYILL